MEEADLEKLEAERKFYLKKTGWLYAGVFFFSAIILIFFALAVKANWQSYTWKNTKEQQIVSTVKDEISGYVEQERTVMEEKEKMSALTETRTKLQEIVDNFNKNQGVQTAPATSTTGTEAQISE